MSGAPRAPGLRNRVRYRFDNLLARGMWAVLLWLGAITLLAVLVSSALLAIFGVTFAGSEDSSWLEDFWQSLLRIIDSGTLVPDVGWGRRVLALIMTLFGILVAGTLIGLIASGVEQRVEAMRRGRSAVVESGHVVILGASARLPVVVNQLILARRGRAAHAVVVLADREPAELQDEVRALVSARRGTRLVFRHGDPTRIADLAIVALQEARALIVLADEGARSDAGVVNAVLAAGAVLGGYDRIPIVAELSAPATAASLVRACEGDVHPVVAVESVARTAAYAIRKPGLNQVIMELLNFGGADIHIHRLDDLMGVQFGEAVARYDHAHPIGRVRADGAIEIAPPSDVEFAAGDRLIVITDDAAPPEGSAAHQRAPAARPAQAGALRTLDPREEHLLIVGWNDFGQRLLEEIDRHAVPGSTAEVVYDSRLLGPDDVEATDLSRLAVTAVPHSGPGSPLSVARASDVTTIVVLGYRHGLAAAEADSRTLLTVMLLRRDLAGRDQTPRIVVELLLDDNVELARITGADDYVVSDGIASRLMVQFALQPARRAIFLGLYAEAGPSLDLVPVPRLRLGGEVAWAEVVSTAYEAGALAIGWRRVTDGGVDLRLNPAKAERVTLAESDQLVVIN